jgi:hypothetical protein
MDQETDLKALKPEEVAEQGWRFGLLSPNGDFYGCAFMGHHNLAVDLQDAGILDGSNYTDVEDHGWMKFQDRSMDSTPMEFTFSFNTSKRVSRPALPEEKSMITMNGVRMVDENVEVYHKVTQQQIDFIVAYKKAQNLDSVNFNWRDYTISEFLAHVEDWNNYSDEQEKEQQEKCKKG